jgi:DNA polymerase III delta prime subunit
MQNLNLPWTEKYRPSVVDDCILPEVIKDRFRGIIESGEVPNLMLAGPAGTGKTTIAKAVCGELDLSYIFINASNERGIDTVRNKIAQFCSTRSFNQKRKVVILDEADNLTADAQTALKGMIEEFAANSSFIFTCNFKNRIIPPLHSRTSVIEFRVTKEEKKTMMANLVKRIVYILKNEDVKFDPEVLVKVCTKFFPDIRRLTNELQNYANHYKIVDEGILSYGREIDVDGLFKALKSKNYPEVREWVVNALDNDPVRVYRKIYENLDKYLNKNDIPMAVCLIHDYQFQNAFSADPEVCLLAFLTKMIVECEFE